MIEVTKEVLKGFFVDREKKYFRKYDFGLVLVIGGGQFYSGSPALSAFAAFKTGADMVKVISPKRSADIIAGFSPNLSAYPLDGDWLSKKHLPILLSQTESAKTVSRGNLCVVIGGGAGRSEETKETIIEYLSQIDVPVVIDAAAIHAVGESPEIISNKPFLVTPHSYEFFVLTKKEIYKLSHEEKQEFVKEEAERLKTTILLKDKPDIISDGKDIALNSAGSPYMSVGGTGDALAGVCGALMSRNISPFIAAQAATWILGKAGELAAEKLKDGLLATDVIDMIPSVLR